MVSVEVDDEEEEEEEELEWLTTAAVAAAAADDDDDDGDETTVDLSGLATAEESFQPKFCPFVSENNRERSRLCASRCQTLSMMSKNI